MITSAQYRILKTLSESDGPLSKAAITEAIGSKTPSYASLIIGPSDPEKRRILEQTKYRSGGTPDAPRLTLLSLGYVQETELVGDITETVYEITPGGTKAVQSYEAQNGSELPALRN